MIRKFLQEKLDRMENCVKENLNYRIESVVKKYLYENSEELWAFRGKISQESLEKIKEKVRVDFFEYQNLCDELRNAENLKILLKEKIIGMKTVLETDSVMVVMEAKHLCVSSRGIQDESSYTSTIQYGGIFNDKENRNDFFNLINKEK